MVYSIVMIIAFAVLILGLAYKVRQYWRTPGTSKDCHYASTYQWCGRFNAHGAGGSIIRKPVQGKQVDLDIWLLISFCFGSRVGAASPLFH